MRRRSSVRGDGGGGQHVDDLADQSLGNDGGAIGYGHGVTAMS